jgi:hypothetical protein
MNRQETMFYGQTANTAALINFLPLATIYYQVMYCITVILQYKRGAEMNKEEIMAKVKKMPVEEKYKLLSAADKAYIRGFLDRSVIELMRKDGPTKQKEKQNENGKR